MTPITSDYTYRINPAASTYFDLVRIMGAFGVFLAHASAQKWSGGLLWQLEALGPRRVDVFFVLSGFLIAHVTARSRPSPRSYAISRIARIYSVAIPVVLLTLLFDLVGQSISMAPYVPLPRLVWSDIGTALLSLTFVGQVWRFNVVPGSNEPWWSLGYEIWFYLTFAAYIYLPQRWRLLGSAGALALGGPGIASLFPLFAMGVLCHDLATRGVSHRRGLALALGTLATVPVLFLLPSITLHYATGVLVALHLLGLQACSSRVVLPHRLRQGVAWLAGGTFTLFLLHWPVMEFLVALSPWGSSEWGTRAMVYLGVPLLCFAVAELSERRKAVWRNLTVSLFERCSQPRQRFL